MKSIPAYIERAIACLGRALALVLLACLSVNGFSQENTLALCSDGLDNDYDGSSDCNDDECIGLCADNLVGECVTIDFETVLGLPTVNQTTIINHYLGAGVVFSLSNGDYPTIVDYFGVQEGFTGPGGADAPNADYVEEPGGFFLTDDGISGGTDAIVIIMEFMLPVQSVSGQILDIDNFETFEAIAYDQFGTVITSDLITTDSPETGNGVPTPWEFSATDQCIWKVELVGEANSTIGFGYGVDNLNFCYSTLEEICDCLEEDIPSDWLDVSCFGCTDPEACNYEPEVLNDDGTCYYPDGCTDAGACNYDSSAQCDDGSCLYGEGCTDSDACNFDPEAQCDDSSCIYPDGCTDPEACNYSSTAQCDDGSCYYPDGCVDPVACNYNPAATCDDGSCDYSCLGCTDPLACNYDPDPEVTVDDGSCTYPGCTDPLACNYDNSAGCDDGSCILPDGCDDPIACNYDEGAVCNDGSCDYESCSDCAGTPFGIALWDTCGVCLEPADPLFNFSCVGDLYIPNAFTPDGDGINDVFKVESARPLLSFEIWIVNRWGDVVYHSTDPDEVWLGDDQNGEYFAPDGMYLYKVDYEYRIENKASKTGHLSLIR